MIPRHKKTTGPSKRSKQDTLAASGEKRSVLPFVIVGGLIGSLFGPVAGSIIGAVAGGAIGVAYSARESAQ